MLKRRHPLRGSLSLRGAFFACALETATLSDGCTAHIAAATAQASSPPTVVTVLARPGSVHPTLRIAGIITPYRQIGVSSALSEPLVDVDVREGERVRAGQVLARLETDDLQAQLVSAQRVVVENRARLSQTAYTAGAVVAQNTLSVTEERVLIVEDDRGAREALAELLRGDGYAVVEAADLAHAREALASHDINAMLTDLKLPDGDGQTLLDELSVARRLPATIVMTAFSSGSRAIQAMRGGADDYVQKSIDFDALCAPCVQRSDADIEITKR